MNRKEYLNRLAEALDFLDDETRDAALSFYAEMIDDRVEDGMDELSAVQSMDQPEVIAARMRAEAPEDQQGRKEPQAEKEAPAWDEAMEFSSLAEKIQRSVEEAMKDIPERLGTFREKAERAAEYAQQAARAAEEQVEKNAEAWQGQFSGNDTEDYQQKVFACPAAALRGARLMVENMPLRVYPCQGDQVKLVYYTSERDPYIARMEEGILTLQKPEGEKTRGGFGFSFFSGMRLMFRHSFPTVELTAPQDILADLYARTANASIRLNGFSSLCQLELHTCNSRIVVENVACKSLEMKTCNARLEMTNVCSKRFLHGKSSNARIMARQVVSGEEMTLQTSNGRITLEDGRADAMSLITGNGSIEANCRAAASVTLRTSNASIRGTLPGAQADWQIDSGTSNGSNSLPKHQPGEKPLSAHTSNGSIHLTFEA